MSDTEIEEGLTPDVELEPDDELEEAEIEEMTPAEAAEAEGSAEVAKKLKAATQSYHTRIVNILGRDMEDKVCPTCEGFGFYDGPDPTAAHSDLPSDFVHPDNYVTCQDCNGYGEILSGSKNPAHAVVTCTKCSGLGYKIETVAAPSAPVYTLPTAENTSPQNGTYIPGRGFIPYGATEPLPGTA